MGEYGDERRGGNEGHVLIHPLTASWKGLISSLTPLRRELGNLRACEMEEEPAFLRHEAP